MADGLLDCPSVLTAFVSVVVNIRTVWLLYHLFTAMRLHKKWLKFSNSFPTVWAKKI